MSVVKLILETELFSAAHISLELSEPIKGAQGVPTQISFVLETLYRITGKPAQSGSALTAYFRCPVTLRSHLSSFSF